MPTSAEDPVLDVEQLSVAYGTDEVLDRLDLAVRRGERLAVVGEGASGKTTLATALVDGVPGAARVSGSVTYRPADGDPVAVFDLDDDARQRFRRETVAVVSGDAGGFEPTRALRPQFQPVLRTTGADEARAESLLSAVGLDADRVLDARSDELNRGTEQLAQVVRGLLADPAVLVLDSLPVALDQLARGDRLDALDAAAETGSDRDGGPTVVALGNDLRALAVLADRIAVLHDGHVVEVGPAERVIEDPSHPHTRTLVEFYRGSL